MKANETTGSTGGATGSSKQHGATFAKVLNGRKQPIRGLWERNGKFYAQLTIEDSATGHKRVKRIMLVGADGKPAMTVAQAVAVHERLKVKRTDNDLPTLKRCPKLKDYVETFLAHLRAGSGVKRATSIAKDQTNLRRWVEHMGGFRLDQLKPAHISSYVIKRLNAGAKARTVNIDVVSLRVCLKQARQDGWIQRLPTELWKPLKHGTPKRPFFSVADIERVCTAALSVHDDGTPVTKNGQQLVDYLHLLTYSGARRNETLRLKWADVDFERRQLAIGNDGLAKNHEARTVDFNPALEKHLKDMHARRAPDSEFVFPSPQRGQKDIAAKSFNESLKLARAKAGLPDFGFHDCRHTFISLCVMAGTPFMTISAWVGHKDGGVLIGKVYGHLASEHRQAMAAKLSFEPVVIVEKSATA